MKHLSVVFIVMLSALLFAVSSCNKEKSLGKKYMKELCRTWRWNGYHSYWNRTFTHPADSTLYIDTLMTVKFLDDAHVEFMGKRLEGSFVKDNPDQCIYFSGAGTLTYNYQEKKIYYISSTIFSSSSDVTELWAMK